MPLCRLTLQPLQPTPPHHFPGHRFIQHPAAGFHHGEPVAGAGDAGVDQLPGEDGVVGVGEPQGGVGEFRALELVHRDGEDKGSLMPGMG